MKKELPLLLGLIVGLYALTEFYIPHHYVGWGRDYLLGIGQVLAAAAYVLGGINILQVNMPKVRRREADWQYKVVLIAGAAIMGLAGTQFWYVFSGEPDTKAVVSAGPAGMTAPPDVATVIIETGEPDALVKVGPAAEQPATPPGPGVVAVDVPPGKHSVKLYMKAAGYSEVTAEIEVTAGQVITVRGTPKMMWGPSGRVYTWIYDHVFAPCNATMFALLAFFVASAAFRAFRARNAEAALLLGSAIVILIARAPMGRTIHPLLPEISDWILDIPNNAGRRAIMMGAAIGAIATGLRVILGLERSHLGAD
jgi:hypothetical protein